MSKAAAIQAILEQSDSETIIRLTSAVKELDKGIDEKFEAFDEVVQQVIDIVETVESKVESIAKVVTADEEDIDFSVVTKEIKTLKSTVGDLVRSIPSYDDSHLKAEIISLRKSNEELRGSLNQMKGEIKRIDAMQQKTFNSPQGARPR